MEVVLDGCKNEPFSSYLKAIGIIKLISEQKDKSATGFWMEDSFVVDSNCGHDDLLNFFMDEYAPTPIVSPWNNGSGFHIGDNKEGISAIIASNDGRFKLYRETIEKINCWDEVKEWNEKKEKKKNNKSEDDVLKIQILRKTRNELNEKIIDWIDTAAIIDSDDRARFPPILKSGGNEGRLDYSNTFMKALKLTILEPEDRGESKALLKNALFDEPVSHFPLLHIGMFDPGRSGGYNQGRGIEQKEFPSNPWDFILMMEGVLIWTSSIGKKYGVRSNMLHSPFTVRSSNPDEYEIWVPLWSEPSSLSEIRWLFKEGRVELKSGTARTGIEAAEAVSSLGVDRGVDSFKRYQMMKRRGQNYVLKPSDRLQVRRIPEADITMELNPLLKRLDIFLSHFKKSIPAQLYSARRRIDDAILDVLKFRSEYQVKKLIMTIGRMEKLIARLDPKDYKYLPEPISGLSHKWIEMADDGSPDFRIAVSLASITKSGRVGPMRANLEEVDPVNSFKWAKAGAQVAWMGNSLADKITNTLSRRLIDSERFENDRNPLSALFYTNISDISHFIYGRVNESVIEDLIFGLSWIKWYSVPQQFIYYINKKWSSTSSTIIPPGYPLLKLLFTSSGEITVAGKTFKIKPEKSIVSLLRARRVQEACEVAKRRLSSSGLSPVKFQCIDTTDPDRLAASLLIPLTRTYPLHKFVLRP